MKHLLKALLPVAAMLPAAAGAQTLIATNTGTNAPPGGFAGNIAVLNDGIYPPNGQNYTIETVSNYASSTYFQFGFGGTRSVSAFNLTVDNNDDYTVTFYDSGNVAVASRTVSTNQGVVGGGVETFCSTVNCAGAGVGGTFLANLAIASPIQANYARIFSSAGDGLYSIGEAAFYETAPGAAVPEPTTWAMMIGGFGLAGAAVRRRRASAASFA